MTMIVRAGRTLTGATIDVLTPTTRAVAPRQEPGSIDCPSRCPSSEGYARPRRKWARAPRYVALSNMREIEPLGGRSWIDP
jgi:hypothetical protein